MQYTLDSVVQFEGALQVKSPNNQIFRTNTFKTGDEMKELTENPLRAYFGIITVPTGIKARLLYRGSEVITIVPNSQIIEAFTSVEFLDETTGDPVVNPKGSFRGFEIQVQA